MSYFPGFSKTNLKQQQVRDPKKPDFTWASYSMFNLRRFSDVTNFDANDQIIVTNEN